MYQIEKGVPLPPKNPGRPPSPLLTALTAMAVGDSVVVPDKVPGKASTAARALKPKKFTARAEGAGCRVWRTA